MSELTYLQAVVLGAVQGITEFLPISSSGHLALMQRWMRLSPDADKMIQLDLAVHLGTMVAVVLVFAGAFGRFARRVAAELSPRFAGRRIGLRIIALGAWSSLPTALIGLTFKTQLQSAFDKPPWIAGGLIATGILLWATGIGPRPRRGWRRFGWGRALLIGLAQGLAILPGLSRSGTTISMALLLGIKREWATQFSFLIAVPAICGASLLEAREATLHAASAAGLISGPLVAATLVAAVVGYAALRILVVAVRRAKLQYFSYYCWVLGALVLIATW